MKTRRRSVTLLLLLLVILLALSFLARRCGGATGARTRTEAPRDPASGRPDDPIVQAFDRELRGVWVEGEGIVQRTLPDDNEGSRHQRFILRLASGLTLLVAHNIDVAPRLGDLRPGDRIAFRGEYEWNARGGVIHWTHHDPAGGQAGGWIEHRGQRYQ